MDKHPVPDGWRIPDDLEPIRITLCYAILAGVSGVTEGYPDRLQSKTIMKSIDAILEALEEAEQTRDWSRCIALCREGLVLASSLGLNEKRDTFRFNLARLLLGLDDSSHRTPSNVEEAIKVCEELLRTSDDPRRRADALLALGRAYDLRVRDDRQANCYISIIYYIDALCYFTKERDPYTWASIRAAIALDYEILHDLGVEDALKDALLNLEGALEVFTQSDYAEDWEDTTARIAAIRQHLE